MKEASEGYGVDRHLMGLKLTAIEEGIELPDLLKQKIFARSSTWRLSTSQLPCNHIKIAGYGPSTPDGYGLFYLIRSNVLDFSIAAFRDYKETSAERLGSELDLAYLDMKKLFEPEILSKL